MSGQEALDSGLKWGAADSYDLSVNTSCLRTELTARLRARGVLVRDCANYPGLDNHYVRIAVRTHAENEQLIKHLEAIWA